MHTDNIVTYYPQVWCTGHTHMLYSVQLSVSRFVHISTTTNPWVMCCAMMLGYYITGWQEFSAPFSSFGTVILYAVHHLLKLKVLFFFLLPFKSAIFNWCATHTGVPQEFLKHAILDSLFKGMTCFPLDCPKNNDSQHNNNYPVWMNQNYSISLSHQHKIYFLMWHRIY